MENNKAGQSADDFINIENNKLGLSADDLINIDNNKLGLSADDLTWRITKQVYQQMI